MKPTSRAGVGLGSELAYVEQRFQRFECQFDLPAQAIDRQHLGGREFPCRQRRGQDEIFRRDQATRIEPGLLAAGVLAQAFMSPSWTAGGLRCAIKRIFMVWRLPDRAHSVFSWA
jgi:hypothetical protein